MTFSNPHASGVVTIQAEHMARHGFSVAGGWKADGGKFVKATADDARLATDFKGAAGVYTLRIHAQDECDGQSVIQVVVNGVVVGTVKLDRDDNGGGSDNGHFQSFSVPGLVLPEDAKIELRAARDGAEFVRIDKITLEKTGPLPTPPATGSEDCFTIEAEDMDLDGFHVSHGSKASGGELVGTLAHTAKLSTDFGGPAGVYDVTIMAQDECDGRSVIEVWVDGAKVGQIKLDRDSDGSGSDHGKFSAFKLSGIEIPEGAGFELRLIRDGHERGRIDAIKFQKTGPLPEDDGAGGGDAPASCHFVTSQGGVDVKVTLTEQADGTMKVSVEVLDSGKYVGDLQGLFFHLADEGKLHGMTVTGADVTGSHFRADKVSDLGNGANMNGAGKFDGGVKLGTSGIGKDDIQSTSFVLKSGAGALTLDDFRGQDFGLRLTSVGKEDGKRCDSLKIKTNAGDLPCDDDIAPPPPPPPPPVTGDSCAFVIKKCGVDVKVTLTELSDGSIQIRVQVLDSGKYVGDLRGVFFDIANNAELICMIATGADVTGSKFLADKVSDLGNGANVNGLGKFDGGVEIGAAGIGKDDVRDVTITIASTSGDLTLDDFRHQDFAIRLTSVGKDGGHRNDSLKIGGNAGALDCGKPPVEVASLGNFVWVDDNGDGLQNDGEFGVEGVTVTLTGAGADGALGTADDTTAVTTTDGEGFYQFTGLIPGQPYKVAFSDIPEDYKFTTPAEGANDAADSDANPLTGETAAVILAPGEYNDTIDAGLVIKAPCVDDGVRLTFSDLAAGDSVFQQYFLDYGIIITAERAGGSGNAAMIFDSYNPTGGDDDLATFGQGNLLIISENDNAANPDDNARGGTITFTFTTTATIGDLTVVDIEETGGTIVLFDEFGAEIRTLAIPAAGDGSITNIVVGEAGVGSMQVNFVGSGAIDDICITPFDDPSGVLVSLGDFVWLDANRDGVQDDTELGVEGVIVRLYNVGADGLFGTFDDDPTVLETLTDDAGFYGFDGLSPTDNYVVEFVAPEGFAFTTPLQGGDPELDSNVDQVTGRSGTIVIGEVPGQDLTIDAGLVVALGTISGELFCDKNGDGLRGPFLFGDLEPGVGPRTVVLFDGGGAEIARTETAEDGTYAFEGLEAGDYSVRFLVQGVTAQNVGGDDTLDSDVDATGLSGVISLAAGETADIDAGVRCLPLSDTGLLGTAAAIDRTQPFIQITNDKKVGTIYDADADLLTINTSLGSQVGVSPTLGTPLRFEIVVGVDENGDLTGEDVGSEFFIWNDANADGLRSAGEEIYVEGDVIRFGSVNGFPGASFLMDFAILTTGGTRTDVFPDLIGLQINAEFANAPSGFAADFTSENAKGLLLGNLAYECLC